MRVQHDKNLLTMFLLGLALVSMLPLGAWGQTLDPNLIPHFVTKLWVPGQNGVPTAMIPSTYPGFNGDYYEIAARQTTQQVLPPTDKNGNPLKSTTIWAFGPASDTNFVNFHTPAIPIAARTRKLDPTNSSVRVKWINDLKNGANFLSYPTSVPIDQGKHWANPTGVCDGNTRPPDCQGVGKGQYAGPVPIAVHLHGSHTWSNSDGIPEAWFLPAGAGLVEPFTRGSDWSQICQSPVEFDEQCTNNPPPVVDGAVFYDYPNTQPPSTLFFHDHTLGITAENITMGLVGPYVLKGKANVDDLAPPSVPDTAYDIPLIIQDRSFTPDGSFFSHLSDDGNTVVVNGNTWPYLEVQPRKYRFRVVLANDSVFFSMRLSGGLKFVQIGNDSGFLTAPFSTSTLNLAPGERADVIVDFAGSKGKYIVLQGNGGDVVQFRVSPAAVSDATVDPNNLNLANLTEGPIVCNPSCPVRNVSLAGTLLGTVTGTGTPQDPFVSHAKLWDSPTTETPTCGAGTCQQNPATEEWDIYNFGGEAHPIHLHEVRFQVLNRQSTTPGSLPTPPLPGETGRKDTVVVKGHSVTRVRVSFDFGGLFAWHCHMTSHEDDEMMRPVCIKNAVVPCNPN
jgi:spore coat protein A, manganese oxidase